MRISSFFASVPFSITLLDLGKFEDLYYAACAKLKELIHRVQLLLTNGFKLPQDEYFNYHCDRLKLLDPVSVRDFEASLLIYEKILYADALVDVINEGVKEKSINHSMHNCRTQTTCHQTSSRDAAESIDEHHAIWRPTKAYTNSGRAILAEDLGAPASIGTLLDTRSMSCAMIYGSLAEKYRPIMGHTELQGASIDRKPTPDALQQGHYQEMRPSSRYISPYNLEERAKKLQAPGGPEMPCICDPECICVPVCASDPTKNCLCEENRLFAPVTQGMDIDDLDVPDLVRRKRSLSSTSSISSTTRGEETCAKQTMHSMHLVPVEIGIHNQDEAMQEMEKQRYEQRDYASKDSSNLATPHVNGHQFWDHYTPANYLQPFAKRCEYPPKRSSVAQRFFNTRSHNADIITKNSTTMYQAAKGSSGNGSSRRISKSSSKPSLADMSFASLKLALRRDSRVGR